MLDFDSLVQKAKEDIKREKALKKRRIPRFDGDQVMTLFNLRLQEQMVLRGYDENEFVADKLNTVLITKLWEYIGLSGKFQELLNVGVKKSNGEALEKEYIKKGHLRKGIMVIGQLGSGKTLIISAFCKLWEDVFNNRVAKISSKEYVEQVQDKDIKTISYDNQVLFIDDVGKEEAHIIDYGTGKHPVGDLLDKRYMSHQLTFITGNYKLATLTDHYGETITDRMREMFNIIILEGNSRRD
jgi:hypothetical protein